MIFDLGPDSTAELAEILKNAKTILWNGPVGVFEFKNFEAGTKGISEATLLRFTINLTKSL